MISLRTKAVLAEVNRRGARSGNPEQAKANRLEAEAHAEQLRESLASRPGGLKTYGVQPDDAAAVPAEINPDNRDLQCLRPPKHAIP